MFDLGIGHERFDPCKSRSAPPSRNAILHRTTGGSTDEVRNVALRWWIL
jgi:hypothetical protein